MFNSVRPHRRQTTRLPCPWDSPGKNTGVGCHFLLQCMKVKSESEVAQSCLTPSNPIDRNLPVFIHGIFQAEYWSGVPLPYLNIKVKYKVEFWILPGQKKKDILKPKEFEYHMDVINVHINVICQLFHCNQYAILMLEVQCNFDCRWNWVWGNLYFL